MDTRGRILADRHARAAGWDTPELDHVPDHPDDRQQRADARGAGSPRYDASVTGGAQGGLHRGLQLVAIHPRLAKLASQLGERGAHRRILGRQQG